MKPLQASLLIAGLALALVQDAFAEEHIDLTLERPALPLDQFIARAGESRINQTTRGDDTFAVPDATRGQLDQLLDEVLRRNPRFTDGIVELSDGRRLTIGRRGPQFLVSPTSGVVGNLPTNLPPSAGGVPTVLRIIDNEGRIIKNTGPQSAGLRAEEGALPCGANTGDPNTHCALSTVRLLDRDVGLFCTGVVITEQHVLTAAHCLCDKEPANLHVKFGAGPFFYGLQVSDEIAFFDGGTGTHCATGQISEISSDNGDLAVLKLVDPDPDDDRSPLDVVAAGILQRGIDAGETLDAEELARQRAMIGKVADCEDECDEPSVIWDPDQAFGNGFATWGWGDGPDGVAGTKRGMIYPLAQMLPCHGGQENNRCQGLQEALFQDREHGLCAGDSGGGVFKAANPAPETRAEDLAGYGLWALMGIVSGDIAPADCHNANGHLLAQHHPRNITRVDTPQVIDWLNTVTDDGIMRSPVRLTYDTQLAGDL
ncbi:hypothetical protein So717_07850 [Roseobacter cerasinus]|uniref:Peptidase S1 domain-containing protein n=1 Tax=Roseobacter cerasinus TaxID=2602289 RepID=A0A640VN07_9RHOB|nr:trypsin-like serine protease [Roseobacter cerasinus]GFE49032.1 hypothetical protein So717_07850 [Roseobacter cerasinus]